MDRDNGNDKEINGIRLPQNVVLELQRLGRALEWYSNGELQSAVNACHMDGRLIDDPNGVNFMDQLELTEAEKHKAAGHENEEDEHVENCDTSKHHPSKIATFCKRLAESRIKRMQQAEELYST